MIISIVAFKGGVGKTTAAIHLAHYLQRYHGETILVDSDQNGSALDWAREGKLSFKVVSEAIAQKQGLPSARHLIIDTKGRLEEDDIKSLSGSDLVIVPTIPDALSLRATMQTLDSLDFSHANYRILLNIIPPRNRPSGERARKAIVDAEFPLFKTGIRRFDAPFQEAALQGVTVADLKKGNAGIAWKCYRDLGGEIWDLMA